MKPRKWNIHVTVPCLHCLENGDSHRISFRIAEGVNGDRDGRPCHICVHHTRITLRGNGTVKAEYVSPSGMTVEIPQVDVEYTYVNEVGRRW